MHKLEGFKSKVKEHCKKHKERMSVVCFKKFEKITLDPSLISASYFPHLKYV
jgi:hypothetical protein